MRLVPALAVEVVLSALILGAAFTTLPLRDYYRDPQFHAYFLNIIGVINFNLPGVFASNPDPYNVNGQLWTIPFEFECYFSIVMLSITRIVRVRALFLALLACLVFLLTFQALTQNNIRLNANPPGRSLVVAFLVAISIYLYRDRIPFSNVLGIVSLVVGAFLLNSPNLIFLATIPVAYVTVWIGLMRPPSISFGDLSYGVFLFHYPMEQTLVHLFPFLRTWWALSLTAVPVTAVWAWLSWTLIEQPTLSRKKQILKLSDRLFDATIGRCIGFARAKLITPTG